LAKPIITFQVEPEQQDELKAYLEAHGIKKRSPFLREAVFAYIHSDKPDLTRKKLAEFAQMRKDFANVGNNLNQMAYRLNAGHPVSTPQVEAVQEELRQTFAQLVHFYRRIEDELRG